MNEGFGGICKCTKNMKYRQVDSSVPGASGGDQDRSTKKAATDVTAFAYSLEIRLYTPVSGILRQW